MGRDNKAIIEAEIVDDKPYDSSDPVQVGEARKRAGRKKRQGLTFVSAILELPQGREWLYQLLGTCDIFRTSYNMGERKDAMAFREGKRFIGLQLLADARQADPDRFNLMLNECEGKKMAPLFPTAGLSDN